MTNRVSIRTGSEGPRHDPYHFEEIAIICARPHFTGTVTVHLGLGVWLETRVPGRRPIRYSPSGRDPEARVAWAFEALAGISIKTARAIPDRLRERRIRAHACGPQAIGWVDGFPGESLCVCTRCGACFDGTFNRSAVE